MCKYIAMDNVSHANSSLNWQTHLNMHSTIRNGEALLLSKLIALSTSKSVLSPQLHDIESILPREFLNSTLELEIFPKSIIRVIKIKFIELVV